MERIYTHRYQEVIDWLEDFQRKSASDWRKFRAGMRAVEMLENLGPEVSSIMFVFFPERGERGTGSYTSMQRDNRQFIVDLGAETCSCGDIGGDICWHRLIIEAMAALPTTHGTGHIPGLIWKSKP